MEEPRTLVEVQTLPALHELNRVLQEVARNINAPRVPIHTLATRPTPQQAGQGAIVFVSDGGAGAVFQGSTGTAWVNLG